MRYARARVALARRGSRAGLTTLTERASGSTAKDRIVEVPGGSPAIARSVSEGRGTGSVAGRPIRRGHECRRHDRRSIVARSARCQHSDVDTRTETRVVRRFHAGSDLHVSLRCDSTSAQVRLDDDPFIAAQAQGGEGERCQQGDGGRAGYDAEPTSSRVRRAPQHERLSPHPSIGSAARSSVLCAQSGAGAAPNRSDFTAAVSWRDRLLPR